MDPAAAAAAAVALAMANTNKARLTLRPFEGREDAADARDFIAKVEAYRIVARLTELETVQAIQFACVPGSVAALWLATLAEEDPDQVVDWATLRPQFTARFSPAMSSSQRASLLEVCRQYKTEAVKAFMDRCRATQLTLDRDIPNDQKTGGNRGPHMDRYNKHVSETFLRGLREDGGLKAHVNGANATTRAEYLAEAVRYEMHVIKAKGIAVVAELDQDEGDANEGDDDGAEVANLTKAKGKKKKGGGGGQAKGGGAAKNTGGGGGGQGQGRAQAGGAPGGPRLCWTCQSADHLNYQCPVKKAGGGGNNQGGNRQRGGGGGQGAGGNQAQPALNEVLGQYLVDSFVRANHGQQNNQGALEALAYQAQTNHRSDGNPFQGFH